VEGINFLFNDELTNICCYFKQIFAVPIIFAYISPLVNNFKFLKFFNVMKLFMFHTKMYLW
jgi:hypothetical protein